MTKIHDCLDLFIVRRLEFIVQTSLSLIASPEYSPVRAKTTEIVHSPTDIVEEVVHGKVLPFSLPMENEMPNENLLHFFIEPSTMVNLYNLLGLNLGHMPPRTTSAMQSAVSISHSSFVTDQQSTSQQRPVTTGKSGAFVDRTIETIESAWCSWSNRRRLNGTCSINGSMFF